MKKHKLLLWNISILVLLTLIYTGLYILLSLFNLTFTHYITHSFIIIDYLLIMALLIQAIVSLFRIASRAKNKKSTRIICGLGGTITSICMVVALLGTILFSTFRYEPVHVVEKNGKTMIVYVDAYIQKELRYYDYKNIFVRGKQIKILEECKSDGYDPFKNGGSPSIDNATYYDETGSVIQRFTYE